jgi:glyoxylase-like metal-dependent hydrolase (beta-lactamase superfamily II)
MDIFLDGSLYIVDALGHLPGHINLLVRTGIDQYVYLGGDACHDRSIMRKEKAISTWSDAEGFTCCIHVNREEAEETIKRVHELEQRGIEVIFAHDVEWEHDPKNRNRFWGRKAEKGILKPTGDVGSTRKACSLSW